MVISHLALTSYGPNEVTNSVFIKSENIANNYKNNQDMVYSRVSWNFWGEENQYTRLNRIAEVLSKTVVILKYLRFQFIIYLLQVSM